ncbi:type II secretion system protein M [Duganella sp. LX20W]|uniref:Type II secretion system protein M n=1 Tax=Rugamonas brunnea TaxID=2758569 RepID=A0A7W2IE37_9BURK|nr:type II secretion system protein M [Rugamonas brunnea]MBA5640196.1 type II secretion system protein M [Rugamonas brunnea]
MKAQWIKLCTRLDAMTLRERVMVFAAVAASIVFLAFTMVMEPLLAKQKVLLAQINQQQNQIAGIDREIAQMAAAFVVDPDAEGRARLQSLQKQIDEGSAALQNMQKGLVAPEKIAPLLEHILRGNGKLRLLSMKTLPVSGLSEARLETGAPAITSPQQPAAAGVAGQAGQAGTQAAPGAPATNAAAQPANAVAAAPAASKPRELLYRHGVEIVLQGSYADMVQYMDALQALPSQLFWGKAKLDAGQYPSSRLTLTLYTLSLDTKWMKL